MQIKSDSIPRVRSARDPSCTFNSIPIPSSARVGGEGDQEPRVRAKSPMQQPMLARRSSSPPVPVSESDLGGERNSRAERTARRNE